jgi:hypothetical protein
VVFDQLRRHDGQPAFSDRENHPLYYALIEAFLRLTGIPMVLNTSFNIKGEPIGGGALAQGYLIPVF